jgi:adenylate cyclase
MVAIEARAFSDFAGRQGDRIQRAVRAERKSGSLLSFRIRLVVMVLVGCYLLTYGLSARQFINLGALVAFCATAWAQYRLAGTRWDRPLIIYLIPVVDAFILVVVYFLANDWEGQVPRLALDEDRGFSWFLLLLTLQALAYRPGLAAWAGLVTAATWIAVLFWMLSYPGAYAFMPSMADRDLASSYRVLYDPLYINAEVWEREALIALLCGGILAVAVQRSQGMTSRALKAERSRANLARYFSPSMVDRLAAQDQPFDRPNETEVGVLFADIVGFTRMAEASTPAQVIALLREFHGRVARVVFDNGGTLDKFIGDCVMATFGTPANGPTDATRAVTCCFAIAAEIDAWNAERRAAGLEPIRIGIGAHFGRVVVGDIGDERRLEFAVLGDTVNVASRLEALTRPLGATMLVSDDLVQAARREGFAADPLLPRLRKIGEQRLRHRDEPVAVWAS